MWLQWCILLLNELLLLQNQIMQKKGVAFKNNAPLINCIVKINNVLTDNAEDLGVVMPMYNLLEYSKNYKNTTCSLSNYYRDESSNTLSSNSESFKYKTSITGNTYDLVDRDNGYDVEKVDKNETEIVVSLKHLTIFGEL